MKSLDWLFLKRKVRFGDCESAGVLHFHNLLRWSHESWEESIDIYGISYDDIFPNYPLKNQVSFPIVSCEANFYAPIRMGDLLTINLSPKKINNHLFEIKTLFLKEKLNIAEGKIIHCSIDINSRKKVSIPDNLERWIEASKINNKIEEY